VKKILNYIIFCLLLLNDSFAQEIQHYDWHLKDSVKLGKNAVWSVDILQNIYVSDAGVVNKYDSTKTLKFSQSIKSLGELSDLIVINTMKLVYFSDEQQILCYMDNTLAQNEDCIRLGDRDIISATTVAKSDRSNKVWVFDDINSRLLLIDTESENVAPFIIENVRSIIGEGNVAQMIESGGRLYLNCPSSGVFIFDLYGALVGRLDDRAVRALSADQTGVYLLLNDHEIKYKSITYEDPVNVSLPISNVQDLKVSGSLVYLKSGDFVYKYSLEKSN